MRNKMINQTFPSLFKLIEALQKKNKQLEVTHSDKVWVASFSWNPPAPMESIKSVEKELGFSLPQDYVTFLTKISDGATLYYDIKYGQWGYKIYGTNEIIKAQMKWESVFEEDWKTYFLAIGKIIGETHVLIQLLDRPTKNKDAFELRDGNPLDTQEDWDKISLSFHEWIENLITAQGAKYWL